jgi:hypothetical protein
LGHLEHARHARGAGQHAHRLLFNANYIQHDIN